LSARLETSRAPAPAPARPAGPPPLFSRRRAVLAGVYLVVLIGAPHVFHKGYALSLLCQIGVMTIFALSYNMLLGQTGLLSFGHAVYYGLGAFGTLHVLNLAAARHLPIPVTLLPLAGGVAGLLFGLTFGYATTRRGGTTFAMITLGIGEMVAASSLMFPAVFGGEGGISGNRVIGNGWLGITYGPQIQMYYLITAWAVVCLVAMWALTQTPLGRIANAVRDNPERAQFVGYSPQRVRWLMVVLSGFFAGVAGGLTALNYEIVTSESVSAYTSGIVILMVYVGGAGFFLGPVIGALIITVLQIAVAGVTQAWPFYFGLFFLVIVLYAPGGIASVIARHRAVVQARLFHRLLAPYLATAGPLAIGIAGVIAMVEMAYAGVSSRDPDSALVSLGAVTLDARRTTSWLVAAALVGAGIALLRLAWRRVAERWAEVGAELAARGAPAPGERRP
jgi:branched-chain amino acid transport system permease protein